MRDCLILVPIDLSPLGEAKLPVVEQYARVFDADVLLLHVLPPGALDPAAVSPTEATARTYLDTVAARLRNAGVRATSVLRSGPPAAAIVDEAISQGASLIVLGANVRPPLPTVVLGSVADQVARQAPCPVLLINPQQHPSRNRTRRQALRSFHEDAERAGVLTQRHVGLRTIETSRIVGSVGRHKELGPNFRPPHRRRRRPDEDRFRRIARAMEEGAEMPPIDVYKLGFGYYVLDGHHRLAAALQNGQVEIEANVTEFLPLADEEAPELFAARRAFERATGLTDVGAARAESYVTLQHVIEEYRQEQGLAELPLAAKRWDMLVYRPLWQAIRARQLSALFPGDRSADVFARLAAWRDVDAPHLGWEDALDAFVAQTASVSSR
jgi:nucleotide-binding universal stress UspA family protein